MKVLINQIQESISPKWRRIRDIKHAESKPGAIRRFEQGLCWIVISLILAIVALVFLAAASST